MHARHERLSVDGIEAAARDLAPLNHILVVPHAALLAERQVVQRAVHILDDGCVRRWQVHIPQVECILRSAICALCYLLQIDYPILHHLVQQGPPGLHGNQRQFAHELLVELAALKQQAENAHAPVTVPLEHKHLGNLTLKALDSGPGRDLDTIPRRCLGDDPEGRVAQLANAGGHVGLGEALLGVGATTCRARGLCDFIRSHWVGHLIRLAADVALACRPQDAPEQARRVLTDLGSSILANVVVADEAVQKRNVGCVPNLGGPVTGTAATRG